MASKKKPTPKTKTKPKPKVQYAQLARAGDVDALFGLMDLSSSTNNDRDAYKWLCAASDFGHEEADDLIGDVMEVSSMRYDDDGYETAAAHWELGVAYLAGEEGLEVDLACAARHLEEAFATHDLEAINAGAGERYSAEAVRKRITEPARELLDFALAGGDLYARVEERIARVVRVREVKAPAVVVDDQKARLKEAADALFAAGAKGLAAAPGTKPKGVRSLDAIRLKVRRALGK